MENKKIIITSAAFKDGGDIPVKYTSDGKEINPPLHIEQIPQETKTMAIIVEDPDSPKGTFDHWIVWNIEPTSDIKEDSNPGISGKNGSGKTGYHGPNPPNGSHRYYFYVYALDTDLDLRADAGKEGLQKVMQDHIIAQGNIMGRYQKSN